MPAYRLASRSHQKENTVVRVGDVSIGEQAVVCAAGPCTVEGFENLLETAKAVKEAGAVILRGGTYKMRSSPYSFQGMGLEGLKLLAEVGRTLGMPVVSEVTDTRAVETVASYVDMLQIGSRNMQNTDLLREVGRGKRPVLLKRGFASTIEEWLLAAEYILKEGNSQVVLCERGIRTFEPSIRFSLDILSIPLLKQLTHLPVFVDPSHAAGRADLVPAVAKAAVAAGADGLLIEVNVRPETARVDGAQTISTGNFAALITELRAIASAVNRGI
jgi:3-deoxy-7-phosphoheptulonate synthase